MPYQELINKTKNCIIQSHCLRDDMAKICFNNVHFKRFFTLKSEGDSLIYSNNKYVTQGKGSSIYELEPLRHVVVLALTDS